MNNSTTSLTQYNNVINSGSQNPAPPRKVGNFTVSKEVDTYDKQTYFSYISNKVGGPQLHFCLNTKTDGSTFKFTINPGREYEGDLDSMVIELNNASQGNWQRGSYNEIFADRLSLKEIGPSIKAVNRLLPNEVKFPEVEINGDVAVMFVDRPTPSYKK